MEAAIPQVRDVTLAMVPQRRAGAAASSMEVAQELGGALDMALLGSGGTAVYRHDLAGAVRRELETHLFGTLRVIRAFAPVLASHGGGAIVNVLSVLSWMATPRARAPTPSPKAAEWNMTNGIRVELAGRKTLVQGLHLGGSGHRHDGGHRRTQDRSRRRRTRVA